MCYSGAHIVPPETTPFEQAYIAYPIDKHRCQNIGANFWAVNKDSKHLAEATEFAILGTTDWDILEEQMGFSLAPYETRKHIDVMPAGPFRECHEISLSRQRFSKCPQCQDDVVMFTRWYGSRGLSFRTEMGNAIGAILMGEVGVQEAMDEVKAKVDQEIQEKIAEEEERA
jgi:endogenous inhibitor of DNA gyrase (YacG/DUF329 family)